MLGHQRGADRRGKKHGHAAFLALVPCRNQPLSVLQDLTIKRTPSPRLLLGLVASIIFHLALVESHGGIVLHPGPAFNWLDRPSEGRHIWAMCGRVRLSSDFSEIRIKLKFDAESAAPNFEADWNKPPTAPMLVAVRSVEGKRTPRMMKWGLIPRWAKDDKIQYSTHNARVETFRDKPAFRDAWIRERSAFR